MKYKHRTAFVFLLIIFFAALVFLLNIGFGSARIGVREIIAILFSGADSGGTDALIIFKIRLPRALAALACGTSLAVSGYLLQTFFNNPIVEPYILGISSGATLFVGFVILGGMRLGFVTISPQFIFAGAFIGSLLIMLLILFASRRVKSMITLLIIGLMTGYLCGAGVNILSAFAEKEQIARFYMWSMGSFAPFTMEQTKLLYVIILPSVFASMLLSKQINALAMGESYALSMGINVKTARQLIIIISSILCAAVTAFAGPVSFIGLAAPHICRILFRTANSRILIPACCATGALMALFCDFIARNIVQPIELPLGAITAIIGAPIVVWLLSRKETA
ncbi:MAG: iron ABC transporter permease [Termitinemataceae bacterium]|nr:MAG: iron ABC transporter permease [Termitinemataceae bacterium]